jgi:hypothetical protein
MKTKSVFWKVLLIVIGGLVMTNMTGCDNGTTSTNTDTIIGSWQAEGIEITFENNGTVTAKQSTDSGDVLARGTFVDKKTEAIITYTESSIDGGSTWQTMTGEGAEPQVSPYSFSDGKLIMGGVTYTRK